jgi:hypothetical protein
VQAAHAYIQGHHGKRHLPTLQSLVTEASSKTSTSNGSKNHNKFCGIPRESTNVDFTQQLKNDSGLVLKPGKR